MRHNAFVRWLKRFLEFCQDSAVSLAHYSIGVAVVFFIGGLIVFCVTVEGDGKVAIGLLFSIPTIAQAVIVRMHEKHIEKRGARAQQEKIILGLYSILMAASVSICSVFWLAYSGVSKLNLFQVGLCSMFATGFAVLLFLCALAVTWISMQVEVNGYTDVINETKLAMGNASFSTIGFFLTVFICISYLLGFSFAFHDHEVRMEVADFLDEDASSTEGNARENADSSERGEQENEMVQRGALYSALHLRDPRSQVPPKRTGGSSDLASNSPGGDADSLSSESNSDLDGENSNSGQSSALNTAIETKEVGSPGLQLPELNNDSNTNRCAMFFYHEGSARVLVGSGVEDPDPSWGSEDTGILCTVNAASYGELKKFIEEHLTDNAALFTFVGHSTPTRLENNSKFASNYELSVARADGLKLFFWNRFASGELPLPDGLDFLVEGRSFESNFMMPRADWPDGTKVGNEILNPLRSAELCVQPVAASRAETLRGANISAILGKVSSIEEDVNRVLERQDRAASDVAWLRERQNNSTVESTEASIELASAETPGRKLELIDYMYFSIYTITTTGYGDIAPVTSYAKFVGSLANFFEIFFMVILFNVLLSSANRDEARGGHQGKVVSQKEGGKGRRGRRNRRRRRGNHPDPTLTPATPPNH